MVILIDLLLALGVLLSANIALGWSEMASFPVGGDKSGLAGLGGIVLFMGMRWLIVAVALLVAVARNGFAGLPGSKSLQALVVIGVHVVLGIVSVQAFEWVVNAIQQDRTGPLQFAWVFGLLQPGLVFALVFFALHRSWTPRHPWATTVVLVLMAAAHLGGWKAGIRVPAAAPAPTHRSSPS